MKTIRKTALSFLTLVFCCALAFGLSTIFNKPQKTSATGEIDVLKTARLSSVRGDYLLLATAFDIEAAKAQGADSLVYTNNGEVYETDTYYSAVAMRTNKNDPTAIRTSTAADIYKNAAYSGYMLAVLEIENDITRDNDYEITFEIKRGETTIATGTDLSASVDNRASEGLAFTLNAGGNDYSVSKGTATATDIVIPAVYNDKPVTGISNFSYYTSMTNVTIPDSVTKIGNNAFNNCTGLTSITIPDSVTNIEGWAFEGCNKLTSITIGNNVTYIGGYAFNGCSLLNSAYYNGDIGGWCDIYFGSETANPMCFTKKIYIKENEEYVVPTNIIIPNDVTIINNYAFYNFSSITNVTIPDSVTSIGRYAFRYCDNLTNITIPDSITNIGEDAFRFCSILNKVYYEGDVAGWCDISFANRYSNPVSIAHNLYIDNVLTEDIEITITGEKTSVGYNYSGWNGLSNVTISSGVTTIEANAFSSCTSLTNITIPNSVTNIGEAAFNGCKFTSINIPEGVTSIGANTLA